jgi:hypothetical protein
VRKGVWGLKMIDDLRRAQAAFCLYHASGAVGQQGEAEAVVGEDALSVGPLIVDFQDADALRAADYRIELDLWPDRRLVLTQLGRRFDTFTQELRRARNQARVSGLLAHGITSPEVFSGAVLGSTPPRPAEIQVYHTHVTVVPHDGDPWQAPLGALTAVATQDDPAGVVLKTEAGHTVVGQLGRHRDAFQRAVLARLEEQARLLTQLTGEEGFADGLGIPRARINGFERQLERFTAPERLAGAEALLAVGSGEPRLGFVQLLDPDGEALQSPEGLPENWASFLLVPAGGLTVFEILAGPSAATYVFRGGIEAVNRDLQALHFRRSQLALTGQQAEVTPANPHRLALRKLAPLQRLRESTATRLIHSESWVKTLHSALA